MSLVNFDRTTIEYRTRELQNSLNFIKIRDNIEHVKWFYFLILQDPVMGFDRGSAGSKLNEVSGIFYLNFYDVRYSFKIPTRNYSRGT